MVSSPTLPLQASLSFLHSLYNFLTLSRQAWIFWAFVYLLRKLCLWWSPLFFFLFRGSNICQSHIQSNFYYNGHSDSPYIDSLFLFYFIFIFLTGSLLLKSPLFTDWLVANVFYRVFSRDITAAILLSQNNETAAMLVSQTSPLGVELFSYANAFFWSNKFA